jgi:hypothetical protein
MVNSEDIIVNTSAKCGYILFSVFQVDHENVALHMVSKQTLTSAGNDFEFPMGSKSNKTCQGP